MAFLIAGGDTYIAAAHPTSSLGVDDDGMNVIMRQMKIYEEVIFYGREGCQRWHGGGHDFAL